CCYFPLLTLLCNFFLLLRREYFFGFSAAATSRRFLAAHLGLLTWRPRAIPKLCAGTFSVIVEPAATYAPSPIRTGATRTESLPMKTPLPIWVGCFWKPS